MAIYSSILAWKIPWTEQPSGLYTAHGCHKKSDMGNIHSNQKTTYFIEKKLIKKFSGYRILELEKFLDCKGPVCDWTCVTITEWSQQYLFH